MKRKRRYSEARYKYRNLCNAAMVVNHEGPKPLTQRVHMYVHLSLGAGEKNAASCFVKAITKTGLFGYPVFG